MLLASGKAESEGADMSLDVLVREREPGVFLIELIGEVNTETSPELEKRVKPLLPKAKAFILELKALSYISSMGLSAVFRLKQAIEALKGTLVLVHPQPQVQKVFDVVKVFPEAMMASLEEADEYLDSFLDNVQKGNITPKKPNL
jgi:anti-anti-sigma factor